MTKQRPRPEKRPRASQPETSRSVEVGEQGIYAEVAMGYCQPFADPDQIVAYCFQRLAGRVSPHATMRFSSGKAAETDFANPNVLTLEATKDIRLGDPEQGNFTHQMVVEDGAKREVCAAYVSFKAVEADLAENMPDRIEELRRMAEYIQASELGGFSGGIKQPSMAQLFKGAQLAYFDHPALVERFGIQETDQQQALEECFELFRLFVETKQDPFEIIDISLHDDDTAQVRAAKKKAQRFSEIAEFQRQHDRELLRDERPSVRQLPSGVQIGYLDLRGKQLILGERGMGIGYRKSDLKTGHKSDILVLDADLPDGGHKILIGVNTRNPHARNKGLDLGEFARAWNNLEYVRGVGAAELKGENKADGHKGGESFGAVTLLGSPAETGTGLDAGDLVRALNEYYRVPRYSEAQLLEYARLLTHPIPGAWVESIAGPYPNQHLRERAIVSCALSPESPPHEDHTCTTCRREIRESELLVEQSEGETTSVRQMTGRELDARAYDEFEHFVREGDAQNALFELARGRVDLADYEVQTGEVLLPFFEQVAQSEEAIDLIYNAQNDTFNPLPDSEGYLPWSNRATDVRVSKYQLPGAVPYMIDSQLQRTLYEYVSSNVDEQAQERFVGALTAIFSSSAYRNSRSDNQLYDHVGVDLLRIATNQIVRPVGRQRQADVAAAFSPDVQEQAREALAGLTPAEAQHLHAHFRFSPRALELLPPVEEVPEPNILEVTHKETGRTTQKHIAVIIGRQENSEGQAMVDMVESGVMSADTLLRSEGLLRPEDFADAEKQVLQEIEAMTERMVEELPSGAQGELHITVQGPQSISFLLGQQLVQLRGEYGDLVAFRYHQWRNGKYDEMPQLNA